MNTNIDRILDYTGQLNSRLAEREADYLRLVGAIREYANKLREDAADNEREYEDSEGEAYMLRAAALGLENILSIEAARKGA